MCLLLMCNIQWCNFNSKEYNHYDITYIARVSMNGIGFDKETFKTSWRRGLPFLDEWRSFRLGMTWCALNWHQPFQWRCWSLGSEQNSSSILPSLLSQIMYFGLKYFNPQLSFSKIHKDIVCLHQKLFFNLNSWVLLRDYIL